MRLSLLWAFLFGGDEAGVNVAGDFYSESFGGSGGVEAGGGGTDGIVAEFGVGVVNDEALPGGAVAEVPVEGKRGRGVGDAGGGEGEGVAGMGGFFGVEFEGGWD